MSADPADRREEILDAAAVVISERGIDSARLADIAEVAGVSLGLVQHYFRHRDQLFAQVFRRESERIAATWSEVVDPQAPPLRRLIDYLRLCTPQGSAGAARPFRPGWAFWLELWGKANREENVRAEVEGVYAGFSTPFARAIEEGVAAGEFTLRGTVADSVDRLVSQIDGSAVRTLLGVLDEERMFDLLVESLCVELGLSPQRTTAARKYAAREPKWAEAGRTAARP